MRHLELANRLHIAVLVVGEDLDAATVVVHHPRFPPLRIHGHAGDEAQIRTRSDDVPLRLGNRSRVATARPVVDQQPAAVLVAQDDDIVFRIDRETVERRMRIRNDADGRHVTTGDVDSRPVGRDHLLDRTLGAGLGSRIAVTGARHQASPSRP